MGGRKGPDKERGKRLRDELYRIFPNAKSDAELSRLLDVANSTLRGAMHDGRDISGLTLRGLIEAGGDAAWVLTGRRADGGLGVVSRAYAATLDDGATVEAGGARAADADRGEAVARGGQAVDAAQADVVELVMRILDGLPVVQRRALSDAEWAADRVALLRRAVGIVDDLRDAARGRS
jgi:hypothetical protein